MAERNFIIRDSSIEEVHHTNNEIKTAKDSWKDVIYRWYDNEKNIMYVLDYNKKRIQPLVQRELEKMHFDWWWKKNKLFMLILIIALAFFAINYFTLKSENELIKNQLNSIQKKEEVKNLNPLEIKKEPVKEEKFEELNSQNEWMFNQIEDLQKSNSQALTMLELEKNWEISILQTKIKILEEAKNCDVSKYDLYKQVENEFTDKKREELKQLLEQHWIKEKKDYIKDHAAKVCENYFSKK